MEKLATLMARNTVAGFAKDPRTWRVCKHPFNALTDAWQFTEWTIEAEEAHHYPRAP
jgi:hypothetical protein